MKALNVEIIDVQGKVDYSDYVVVMSGKSDRQVSAVADRVQHHLLKPTAFAVSVLRGYRTDRGC